MSPSKKHVKKARQLLQQTVAVDRDLGARPCDNYADHYHPRKVVVMGMRDVDRDPLVAYFSNFGDVVSVNVKLKPTCIFAFVEFAQDSAVQLAFAMAPHMIKQAAVRVLPAYRYRLPSRPFPGMDPLTSPLRQAVMQQALFGEMGQEGAAWASNPPAT